MPEEKKYKIKPGCGGHRQDGIMYKAGDIVSSTKNLNKIFPHKFKLVSDVPKDDEADKTLENTSDDTVVIEVTEVTDEEFTDKVKKADTKTSVLGTDVTDQFPVAATLELKIYQNDIGYIPVDFDMPNRPLHNAMEKTKLLEWLNNQD